MTERLLWEGARGPQIDRGIQEVPSEGENLQQQCVSHSVPEHCPVMALQY